MTQAQVEFEPWLALIHGMLVKSRWASSQSRLRERSLWVSLPLKSSLWTLPLPFYSVWNCVREWKIHLSKGKSPLPGAPWNPRLLPDCFTGQPSGDPLRLAQINITSLLNLESPEIILHYCLKPLSLGAVSYSEIVNRCIADLHQVGFDLMSLRPQSQCQCMFKSALTNSSLKN